MDDKEIYKVTWSKFDALFDDGMSLGTDIMGFVNIWGWERAKNFFWNKIKEDSIDFCEVRLQKEDGTEADEPILYYCP